MTTTATPSWEAKRTTETRLVENILSEHFERVDSYRYNSASIRLRVIDSRFENLSRDEWENLVEHQIAQLDENTQQDIVTLFCFAPSEIKKSPNPNALRESLLNLEFEDPSPSTL